MDGQNFCPRCGTFLNGDTAECPQCSGHFSKGVLLEQDPDDRTMLARDETIAVDIDNLRTEGFLILAYSAVAFGLGAFFIINSMSITTVEKWDPELYSSILEIGLTPGMLSRLFLFPGIMLLASAVAAFLSGFLVLNHTNHKAAYFLCTLSTALSFPLLFTVIVGAIITKKLKDNSASFSS
jgi:hypothetical protein